jgi:hypothetical protein
MTPSSEETHVTVLSGPSVSSSRTVQPQRTRIGRGLSLSSKRSANSGPGELLVELDEAEAVVDALREYAAQALLALDDGHGAARRLQLEGRRHAGGSAAYHDGVEA